MAPKTKIYGPYDGSEENGKRKIYVKRTYNADGSVKKTTSVNKARKDYEDKNGKVGKGKEVDHKNNNHDDDSAKNLQVLSKSENVGKRNKAVAKKTTRKK